MSLLNASSKNVFWCHILRLHLIFIDIECKVPQNTTFETHRAQPSVSVADACKMEFSMAAIIPSRPQRP